MEKILSAEEFREQTGHILKGTNHFAEMYAKYLLEKQLFYICLNVEFKDIPSIKKASTEFINQLNETK